MDEQEKEMYLDLLYKLKATVQHTYMRPAPDNRAPGVDIEADMILRIAGKMFRIAVEECEDLEPTPEPQSDHNELGQRRERLLLSYGAYFDVYSDRTDKYICYAAWGHPHDKQLPVTVSGDIPTVECKLKECITEFVDRQIRRHSS